jgi:fatty-acyl-CoA synthase
MTFPPVNYELLTPVNFIKRTAEVYPEKPAVVCGDRRYTYGEHFARINRLASALKKLGIGRNDKVAIICPNTAPMLEAHFAVPMIGAALVPVNIRLSGPEVAYILNHSDSRICLVDNECAEPVLAALDELHGITFVNICDVDAACPLPGTDYESLLLTGSPDPMAIDVEDERAVCAINYTSGTTGRPKGVMYHHRGAYLHSLGNCLETGMTSDSVYLWTLPMFHCNGWCFPWAVTAAAGTHICLRKVVPENIIGLIMAERVTHMCSAPIVLIGLANHPDFDGLKLSRPLKITVGGAPPSPTIIEKMESIGAAVNHVYGLTEVYGPYTVCAWHEEWNALPAGEQAAIRAHQGVAYTVSQFLDVLDSTTLEPVPRDGRTIGEVVMRGNIVMLGYYKDPEATAKAFRGDWFHTGDLAVMRPNNYIQILDREKDIIISGGENIATVEIENVLYRHPEVMEVAVVAVPDEKWGEAPKAFVKPKPGCNPTAEELIAFCKENLARFKAPKSVEFTELPKTSTGKIQKFLLRRKEWAGRDLKVN